MKNQIRIQNIGELQYPTLKNLTKTLKIKLYFSSGGGFSTRYLGKIPELDTVDFSNVEKVGSKIKNEEIPAEEPKVDVKLVSGKKCSIGCVCSLCVMTRTHI